MTPEQRQELMRLLEAGEEISPEWARILFPPEKREYELVYHGKDREEDIIADTLAVPLQPVRTFGRNGVDWHNMLIFGDNLQVMKTLIEMKKEGKLCNADGSTGVRLIYIDPPFATKQEFRGTDDQKAYQDKIVGAQFIEFLRRRLVFLRELLSQDGSIYVHLDWKKIHYVKVILDELFGEERFKHEVIWHLGSIAGNAKGFPRAHETVLIYSRSEIFRINEQQKPFSDKLLQSLKRDKNGWYYTRGSRSGRRKLADWEIKSGVGLKTYVDPEQGGTKVNDIWDDIGGYSMGSEEKTGYPTQKPERLLNRIISAGSNPGDIVLDAFAGSGTTCAVSEKLRRRWIGIDCGKLAIYTIQKRMLNLRDEIGNKGKKLNTTPFILYNAGLYDFSKLKELTWQDWRFFALQLFQCRDEKHKIGGIEFDGYRQGASVLVFNHMASKHKEARLAEESIQEIHEAVGSRVGNRVFIIAPALTFDFQQDYIDFDKVRYYALRIPYSIIHELHRREFAALKQPSDEMAVNDTVEAVGFDFIRTPELKYTTGVEKWKGDSEPLGFIKIGTFRSEAIVRGPGKKRGNLETLSMVMLDLDYDEESKVFDLDEVRYADELQKKNWKVRFRLDRSDKKLMAVFVDIYGNEARVLIDASEFSKGKVINKKTKKKVRKKT